MSDKSQLSALEALGGETVSPKLYAFKDLNMNQLHNWLFGCWLSH